MEKQTAGKFDRAAKGSVPNPACPVCRKNECGHLLPPPLRSYAQTPLDRGVARFAEEVFALLKVKS